MPALAAAAAPHPTITLLQTSSLASVVQGELERMILSGELGPGEKLTETVFYDKEQVVETQVDGVLEVARSKSPPISEVQDRLDAIIAYAARRDPHASLSMMQALAPELFDEDAWGESPLTMQ